MPRPILVALAALSVFTAAACTSPKVTKYPAFDAASKFAPSAPARCYLDDEVDFDRLPALAPMAVVEWSFASEGGMKSAAREIAKTADAEVHPDVIVLATGAPYYAGSNGSTFGGFGFGSRWRGGFVGTGFSRATYETPLYGTCYRVLPAQLGLTWDTSGMVLVASADAKKSGILEGDRILSVAGVSVQVGAKSHLSAHHRVLLEHAVGDELQLVWIRPGTGRMEGLVKLQPNPQAQFDLPVADLRE